MSFFSLKGTKTHAVNDKTSLTMLKYLYEFNKLLLNNNLIMYSNFQRYFKFISMPTSSY